MRYFIILIVTSVIYGCNAMKESCIKLKDICAYNKDAQENKNFDNEVQIKSNSEIDFYFSNNPFCLDSSHVVKIYINNKLCFKGRYQYSSKLHLPDDLKDGQPVHFSMLIKSDKEQLVFSLENKSVNIWRNYYKYLYIGIYTTNKNEDLIEFYPLVDKIAK